MALIYTKASEKTVVLAPREGLCRKFNFGSDWTEIRAGMFMTGVADTGPNAMAVSETLAVSTHADRISFGIKNDSTTTIPGFAGSTFLGGITGVGASSGCNGVSFLCPGATGSALSAAGFDGTTLVGGTNVADALGHRLFFTDASQPTGYNGVYALKFVITDRGLSTQSVTISSYSIDIAGTGYSANALRVLLNNSAYTNPIVIPWNDGVSARDIPDCFWVRMPFFDNALRISAIRVIRYAP